MNIKKEFYEMQFGLFFTIHIPYIRNGICVRMHFPYKGEKELSHTFLTGYQETCYLLGEVKKQETKIKETRSTVKWTLRVN